MSPLIYYILYFFIFLLILRYIYLNYIAYELPGIKVFYNTLGRDIHAGINFLKLKWFVRTNQVPAGVLFRRLAKKHPNKVCLIFEDKEWTYQQVEDYSNQVANCFIAEGYEKGQDVALFMSNCPEYICTWLGLSKIGVVPALINTNLKMQSLSHSVNAVDSRAVIFGEDLAKDVKEAEFMFDNKDKMKYYCLGKAAEDCLLERAKSLDLLVRDASKRPPDGKKYNVTCRDKLLYIYTSGTTGLPKAAIIKHSRYLWVAGMKYVLGLYPNDIYYNPLPLYHTAGGLLFVSALLTFGGTMVIRKKFSASNFWTDAIKHNATVSQYIGEICRFLLNQPKKPEDTQHKIRLMVGNGLKLQIWEEFINRFQIKRIIELYGATEGNSNVVNIVGKVGSVGFTSLVFSRLHPVSLIKVNPETGEPLRNENGLCIRCKPGEPGEMVGKIISHDPFSAFDGYADPKATQKKIIHNCFEKGDKAFVSGDILVMDESGFLFFKDRTGDTFRWRGENVSTNEVEDIISKALDLKPCVVFGVQVPGAEGNAGMAVIEADPSSMDLNGLRQEISKSLPSYAIPIFVRICKSIESTGTYKLKKIELKKDGFDPEKCKEPLFFLDPKTRSYIKLDQNVYNEICSGKIRL